MDQSGQRSGVHGPDWTLYGHRHSGPVRLSLTKITLFLAKFNDICSIGWTQNIPPPLRKIASQSRNGNRESIRKFSKISSEESNLGDETKIKKEFRLCWEFLARQIDMAVYYIATAMILCAACAALTPVWAKYSSQSFE